MIGSHDSQARFTIDQTHLEGLIIKDGEQYYVESAQKFSTQMEVNDFVFYKASDVIQDAVRACDVTMNAKVDAGARRVASNRVESPSSFKVIELATEADFEYVSSLGGPTNAVNEILGIMNQVEGVYESQLGLTFRIVFQHT